MELVGRLLGWIKGRIKELGAYLFWGVCTTALNVLCYALLRRAFSVRVATALAWLIAVLFAFVTNKLFVFHSRQSAPAAVLRELSSFIAARLLTGVLDVALMWLWEFKPLMPEIVAKAAVNVLVIALNYFLSIFVVFAKPKAPKAAAKAQTGQSEQNERTEGEQNG